jgi:hypothetical protein
MYQFNGPYCDGEKKYHHHIAVVRIVVKHRQVLH